MLHNKLAMRPTVTHPVSTHTAGTTFVPGHLNRQARPGTHQFLGALTHCHAEAVLKQLSGPFLRHRPGC